MPATARGIITMKKSKGSRDAAPAAAVLHPVRTAWGWAGIVMRGGDVVRVLLPARREEDLAGQLALNGVFAEVARPGRAPAAVARVFRDYFEGRPADPAGLDVALDLGAASPFFRRIYRALRRVPRGRTISYGELARRAGRPGAARAVGQAMARNQLPLLVPCHRVLASGCRLGGFSSPGGVREKERLLALEGISVSKGSGRTQLPRKAAVPGAGQATDNA